MAWFKKKPDPLSDRAHALNEEIARLEAKIKVLDTQVRRKPPGPKLRSTALPHDATDPGASKSAAPPAHEPIFEEVKRVSGGATGGDTAEHYNDLGVRKYDFTALLRRLRNHFRGPAASNPKLVSYLAAGGIQGLQPLRYERRVARNRFIAFVIFLLLMLIGITVVFMKNR
jgi:hypothetical protein